MQQSVLLTRQRGDPHGDGPSGREPLRDVASPAPAELPPSLREVSRPEVHPPEDLGSPGRAISTDQAEQEATGRVRDTTLVPPSLRATQPYNAAPPPSLKPTLDPRKRRRMIDAVRSLLRTIATLLILGTAVLAALLIWNYYVTAPWTRDGTVRVQVASVAPRISGQIVEIRVADNQFVRKGDILYVIDPFDFKVALETARTDQLNSAADLQVKKGQADRRMALSNLATTPEDQQKYVGIATQARAAFESSQARLSQAEINLTRTEVKSPVTGYVTNLLMRVGDYAREGTSNMSIIDSDSYWIDGYFEETKMARICIGDRAEAQLMGYRDPIIGRVRSVTRGISASNATASAQGLPNVDPVYTWVRLAQRVPVRIEITDVPLGVPLVSGMTATVTVRHDNNRESRTIRGGLERAWSDVTSVISPPAPLAGCLSATGSDSGAVSTLSMPQQSPAQSANQIDPGLYRGMTASPRPAQ